MGYGLVSLVVWALVMFGPSATVLHQGSHVFVLIGLGVPSLGWSTACPASVSRCSLAGATVGLAEAVPFVDVPAAPGYGVGVALSRHAVVLGVLGALCLVAAFALEVRRWHRTGALDASALPEMAPGLEEPVSAASPAPVAPHEEPPRPRCRATAASPIG